MGQIIPGPAKRARAVVAPSPIQARIPERCRHGEA
jgi:hypothetical protein